mgnify:CR=1 FL=1
MKEILNVVKKKLDIINDDEIATKYENDLDKFLKDINICLEDYEEALSTSQRGKIVVLKRTLLERNVNNYNKEFISYKTFTKIWGYIFVCLCCKVYVFSVVSINDH